MCVSDSVYSHVCRDSFMHRTHLCHICEARAKKTTLTHKHTHTHAHTCGSFFLFVKIPTLSLGPQEVTWTHTYMHACREPYTHTHIHVHTCTHNTRIHYTHTHKRIHMHAQYTQHTYTHTQPVSERLCATRAKHTHAHTHTRAHTRACIHNHS